MIENLQLKTQVQI